mgnify:CR=1 FL=1
MEENLEKKLFMKKENCNRKGIFKFLEELL